jgi:hypothetical protein
MRRAFAFTCAVLLAAAFAGSSAASGPPTYRANHVAGNFDFLDYDGSVAGHMVVNYGEPSYEHFVPGTLDITWVDGARFPYEQPNYGVKQSHSVLVAGFYGQEGTVVSSGASGSLCDFGAPWNATCHDFAVAFFMNPNGDGKNYITFGTSTWDTPTETYLIGKGTMAMNYVGPTGPQPAKLPKLSFPH